MSHIEIERTDTEDIADRREVWKIAHKMLEDSFPKGEFFPSDVLNLIKYLRGPEGGTDDE